MEYSWQGRWKRQFHAMHYTLAHCTLTIELIIEDEDNVTNRMYNVFKIQMLLLDEREAGYFCYLTSITLT